MPLAAGVFGPITGTPATPQFAKIVIQGTTLENNGSLKPCYNVMHFRALSPAAGGTQLALATDFQSQIEASLQACCTSDYTIQSYYCQFMDNPATIPTTLNSGVAGTVLTDRGPSFQSAVIRKTTQVPSRNFRGSMHFGALPETFTTKDILNSTGTTAYDALRAQFAAMIAGGVTDGVNLFYPVVISATLSDLFANPSIFWGASVYDYVTNLKVGTMKRRKEKGAPV